MSSNLPCFFLALAMEYHLFVFSGKSSGYMDHGFHSCNKSPNGLFRQHKMEIDPSPNRDALIEKCRFHPWFGTTMADSGKLHLMAIEQQKEWYRNCPKSGPNGILKENLSRNIVIINWVVEETTFLEPEAYVILWCSFVHWCHNIRRHSWSVQGKLWNIIDNGKYGEIVPYYQLGFYSKCPR